eukprot:365764-Chlamydomonas_euryale.AAC.2
MLPVAKARPRQSLGRLQKPSIVSASSGLSHTSGLSASSGLSHTSGLSASSGLSHTSRLSASGSQAQGQSPTAAADESLCSTGLTAGAVATLQHGSHSQGRSHAAAWGSPLGPRGAAHPAPPHRACATA